MGLLEERERAARQRVEALLVEPAEAEAVWEGFVIARATVAEVLAEPCGGKAVPPVVVAGERPARVAAAVPGFVVPQWREGLDVGVLAPDYQRLMGALAGGDGSCREAMDCRQLAAELLGPAVAALGYGLSLSPGAARRLSQRSCGDDLRAGDGHLG